MGMWENLSNITIPDYNLSININLSNYSMIQNFTNLSSVELFFTPIFWWQDVLGNWFFTLIYFITVGMVYLKTNSIFPTALTMLLLSATMIALMPYEAGLIIYLGLVLGVFAVLYLLIRGD